MKAPRTATEYCRLVEARLGWMPPAGPEFRRYQAMAKRVNNRMLDEPGLFTFANLALAVELLAREKTARNPLGVFAHVERAVAMAAVPELDVETQIREAAAYETERGDPAGWVTRLTRAVGSYRQTVLNEWKESVR